MVADLWMGVIHATVDLPIENDTGSNSCPDRHVNQPALALAGTPARFAKSSSIGIVLDGHFYSQTLAQISDRILPVPMREEVDITNFTSQRIDRSCTSDPDTGDF